MHIPRDESQPLNTEFEDKMASDLVLGFTPFVAPPRTLVRMNFNRRMIMWKPELHQFTLIPIAFGIDIPFVFSKDGQSRLAYFNASGVHGFEEGYIILKVVRCSTSFSSKRSSNTVHFVQFPMSQVKIPFSRSLRLSLAFGLSRLRIYITKPIWKCESALLAGIA
jgi:hypothetical protein